MIKGYKFLVSEEEKSRILNLHQNRTRSQYLNIFEQETPISGTPSNNSVVTDTGNAENLTSQDNRETRRQERRDNRKKEKDKELENEKIANQERAGISPSTSGAQPNTQPTGDNVQDFQIWSFDNENGQPLSLDTTTNNNVSGSNNGDKQTELTTSGNILSPDDKKKLEFNTPDEENTKSFTYMDGSVLSYNTDYNKNKDGKYEGDIYRIRIFDSDLTTKEENPVLYVYGKPQEGPPDPTEIKFNPNDKEFIKFQDLLNQTKTKEQWDTLISDNLNNKTPLITSSSESTSQTKSSEVKTQFVAPTNHQEGIAQITEKLKSLGYDTSNIGAAVLQYLENNKPS